LSKFILGSGVVGLLARHILGSDYKLIPFKKSRFYSHEVPLADNTIVKSDQASDILSSLKLTNTSRYFPTAVSIGGQLAFNKEIWSRTVVDKLYADDPHPVAATLLAKDIDVYDASVVNLYESLLIEYSDEIMANKDSSVSFIGNHSIVIDGTKHEASDIISTIPLNALLELVRLGHDLKSHDYHIFLVASDVFNLEGARRVFIADIPIPFWKVNILGREAFQFFSNGYIENADIIFGMMSQNRFRILDSTSVKEAFPLGPPPFALLDKLGEMGIRCIGSNARWDYFHDISTSINFLLKTNV
jgi:hypothetical protein